MLLLLPIASLAQQPSNEDLTKSSKDWVFISGGNPIDGFKRTALRMNNEQDEGQTLFMLSIVSYAELVKIENSTGQYDNDRDDISIDLKTLGSFENLDEILMYFDNEKTFYKVNFAKYNSNSLLWWNAVANNDEGFLSRFSFISKLKSKSKVFFRFKYSGGKQINATFTLNGSSSTINRVVDLSNVKNEDYVMDSIKGMFALSAIMESDEVHNGLGIYLNGEIDSLTRSYLDSVLGKYYSTFIYEYEFDKKNRSIEAYDINSTLVANIPYDYFNLNNRIANDILENLFTTEYCQKTFSDFDEFTSNVKSNRLEVLDEISRSLPEGLFDEDFTFWEYCSPLK